MKAFSFLFVGPPKNPNFRELETEYHQKISRYLKTCDLQYVKDVPDTNTTLRCDKEGQNYLAKIKKAAFLIVCDEGGKAFSSPEFSRKIMKCHDDHDQIVFGVGGAYGFSEAVKARANLTLSLAPWTLPHELARIVLMEQVYRALTIARGEKYHH